MRLGDVEDRRLRHAVDAVSRRATRSTPCSRCDTARRARACAGGTCTRRCSTPNTLTPSTQRQSSTFRSCMAPKMRHARVVAEHVHGAELGVGGVGERGRPKRGRRRRCAPRAHARRARAPRRRPRSPASCSMSASTTCMPARASSSAISRPMPLPPPVTTATRPSSSLHGALRRRTGARLLVALGGLFLILHAPELVVGSAGTGHLLLGALVDDAAFLEHDDVVGEARDVLAVGDHERRAPELVHRRDHLVLDAGVEQRGRLVEHEQVGPGEPRPGERDELALRGGEVVALLLDDVVEAAGKHREQVVGTDRPDRRLDLGVAGVGLPVADVRRDRALEQERVLGDDAELGRGTTPA